MEPAATRYTTGLGVALIFYGQDVPPGEHPTPEESKAWIDQQAVDPGNVRFRDHAASIAASLKLHNFDVKIFIARDIGQRIVGELGRNLPDGSPDDIRRAVRAQYKRFAFVFCGHGGFSELQSDVSQHGGVYDLNGSLVSVSWILHEATAAFPSIEADVPPSPPKIFILDCCFSGTRASYVALDAFTMGKSRAVAAHARLLPGVVGEASPDTSRVLQPKLQPKDYVILRSAQPGYYSYSNLERSYASSLAKVMRRYLGDPHYDVGRMHDAAAAEVRSWRGSSRAFSEMTPWKAGEALRGHQLFLSAPLFERVAIPKLPWPEIAVLLEQPGRISLGRGTSGCVSGVDGLARLWRALV